MHAAWAGLKPASDSRLRWAHHHLLLSLWLSKVSASLRPLSGASAAHYPNSKAHKAQRHGASSLHGNVGARDFVPDGLTDRALSVFGKTTILTPDTAPHPASMVRFEKVAGSRNGLSCRSTRSSPVPLH